MFKKEIGLFLLSTCFGVGFADDEKRLDDFEKRLQKLEGGKKTSGHDSHDIFSNAGLSDFMEIHGHIQFEYENFGSAGDRNSRGDSTFDTQYYTLWLGKQINDTVDVAIEIEYEHGGTSAQGGETEVDQARLDWNIFGDKSLVLRFGKTYAPFGIERFQYAGPSNRLVSRPGPFKTIYPGSYAATGFFTYGMLGDDLKFKYELAAVNGLDEDAATSIRSARNARDNNDNKAFVGRLALTYENFEIGTSYYDGKYDSGAATLHFNNFGNDLDLIYQGIDGQFSIGNFDMRGEWVYSSVDMGENAISSTITSTTFPSGIRNFHRDGWYVQGAYRMPFEKEFLNYIDLVTRYSSQDENSIIDNSKDSSTWALGVNWSPMPALVFKLEHQINKERYGGPLSNDAWLAQVSASF